MQTFHIEGHEPSLLPEGMQWKLSWADEFDEKTLDSDKWMYRTNFWGKPFPAFCDRGVTLDGNSNAVFRPVRMEDGRICSAQLQTGTNSFDVPKEVFDSEVNSCGDNNFWPLGILPRPTHMHRYGYYEVRCKLQATDGWWSAFWLQSPGPGTTYDPAWSGVEVDIMEYFGDHKLTSGNFFGGYGTNLQTDARVYYDLKGNRLNAVHETVVGKENIYPDIEKEFHRFGLLWTEKEYVFYFDGKETSRSKGPVSQVPQFILLTTEVKGYRNGDGTRHKDIAEQSLDDTFTVDYVRVFDAVAE